MPPDPLPILPFRSQAAWEAWLSRQHATSEGLWLKLAKKDSGIPSVTYPEAVESALCFGWIDGQKMPFDGTYWLQRFTPRRARSKWSKINCDKIDDLAKAGRLRPAGLREVEAAKRDGRWENAYGSQRTITIPPDFQAELDKRPRAKKRFAELSASNRYAILYRLHDAKRPETRSRRLKEMIQRLLTNQLFH